MWWDAIRYDMRLAVKYIIKHVCQRFFYSFYFLCAVRHSGCTVYGVKDESYYLIFTLLHISTFSIYFTWILECIISCFAADTNTHTLECSKWYQIYEQIDEPKRIKRGHKKTHHGMQIRQILNTKKTERIHTHPIDNNIIEESTEC